MKSKQEESKKPKASKVFRQNAGAAWESIKGKFVLDFQLSLVGSTNTIEDGGEPNGI